MANVAYSIFFPHLIPLVPHVADPVATQAVRDACIEFCKGTMIWREAIDPMSSIQGEAVYELDLPTDATLAHIVDLYYDSRMLTKKSVSELSRYARDWMQLVGKPTMYTMLNSNEIMLVPKPDVAVAGAITGILAFTPSRKSTTVNDDVYEDYAEEITRGAAAKLLMIPNQQWSDVKLGIAYRRQFVADMANARSHVNQAHMQAPISVHLRRFW
jgi:hypothetical protein